MLHAGRGLVGLCLLAVLAGCGRREPRNTSYPPQAYGGYGVYTPYPGPPPNGGVQQGYAPAQSVPAPPALPEYVTVLLQDAAIAPAKPDGRAWDCCGDVSVETAEQVSSTLSLSMNPYAQFASIAALLAPLAGSGTTPPEVVGVAQAYVHGQPGARAAFDQSWVQDSYNPMFKASSGPPTLAHVPLNPSTRIIGELWDRDLAENDPVGPFDINYQHLVAALQSNGLYPVRMGKTILFIRITVLAEQ